MGRHAAITLIPKMLAKAMFIPSNLFPRRLTRAALAILLGAGATLAAAQTKPETEPGLMLREGTWNGDVGTFVVPAALDGKPPRTWPADGWVQVLQAGNALRIEAVVTPPSARPAFLQAIARAAEMSVDAPLKSEPVAESRPLFLRVPGVRLSQGTVKPYLFKNGTPQLAPLLDHRYELKLGDKPFALTVQNGLRGKNGEAYGEGAHYLIEYDGEKFLYSLDGFGWDSRIQAIADLDGDGKPDFFVNVGGSNTGYEYVLLSSLAKPGRNPPTASLRSMGC